MWSRRVLLVIASMLTGGCAAQSPNPQTVVAPAGAVVSPRYLSSVGTDEWCRRVDAALSNPNATPEVREEWIESGHTMKCPAAAVYARPERPKNPCAELLKAIGNPYATPELRRTAQEMARNRGCLN